MIESNLSEIYYVIESLTLSDVFVLYVIAYMGVALVKIVSGIEVDLTNFNFSEKLLATVVILHLLFTLSFLIQNKTFLNEEVGSKAVAILLLVLILKFFEKLRKYYLERYFSSRLTKKATQLLPSFQDKRRVPQKVDDSILRELSRNKSDQYTPIIKEFVLFLYITLASTITVVTSDLYSGAAVAFLSIIFIFLIYKQTEIDIVKAEAVHADGAIRPT